MQTVPNLAEALAAPAMREAKAPAKTAGSAESESRSSDNDTARDTGEEFRGAVAAEAHGRSKERGAREGADTKEPESAPAKRDQATAGDSAEAPRAAAVAGNQPPAATKSGESASVKKLLIDAAPETGAPEHSASGRTNEAASTLAVARIALADIEVAKPGQEAAAVGKALLTAVPAAQPFAGERELAALMKAQTSTAAPVAHRASGAAAMAGKIEIAASTLAAHQTSVAAGGDMAMPADLQLEGDEALHIDAKSVREAVQNVVKTNVAETRPTAIAAGSVALDRPLAMGDMIGDVAPMDGIGDEFGGIRLAGAAPGGGAIATSTSILAAAAAANGAVAQVAAAIKSDKRGDNVEVRLDPPELGRVRIDFTMEGPDAVKAVLTAERAEVLDHLRRNSTELLEQLRSAGFTTVDLEFSNKDSSPYEEFAEAADETALDGDFSAPGQRNIVYLSMRDDTQLNKLV